MQANLPNRQSGFSMVEVLITMIILAVGLLGLAGLQARAVLTQKESYQRAQALSLANDMADRLLGNADNAAAYINATRGTGHNSSALLTCTGLTSRTATDLCEWHNSLLGTSGSAMTGPRGCIYQVAAGPPAMYSVAVAWGGTSPTYAPSIACGQNQYGADSMRRVVAIPVLIRTN